MSQAAHQMVYRVSSRKTSTHNLLHRVRSHAQRQEILPLRQPCLVAVFLRVQIERRLDLAVTQEALHGLTRWC